jgi:hypothetical protein
VHVHTVDEQSKMVNFGTNAKRKYKLDQDLLYSFLLLKRRSKQRPTSRNSTHVPNFLSTMILVEPAQGKVLKWRKASVESVSGLLRYQVDVRTYMFSLPETELADEADIVVA